MSVRYLRRWLPGAVKQRKLSLVMKQPAGRLPAESAPRAPRPITSARNVLGAAVGICLLTVVFCARQQWDIALAKLLFEGQLALWWLVAAVGIGGTVLRLGRTEVRSHALRLTLATSLGLGIISLLILGMGLAGWFNRMVAIGMIVVGIALFVLWILGHVRREGRSDVLANVGIPDNVIAGRPEIKSRRPDSDVLADIGVSKVLHIPAGPWAWLWLAVMPGLGMALVCALVPPGMLWGDEPHGYDVVEYHLQVPREWYEAGQIEPLHHNVFSFFPFNVELHYLLAMHLRGGSWAGMYLAQLMHVSFAGLVVMGVYGVLAEMGSKYATLGAVAAASAPWIILLAPIAYNEAGLMMFGTLATGLMMIAPRSPAPLRIAALAGGMAGFACGAKPTAAPMVLLAVPVAFVIFAARRPSAKRERESKISIRRILTCVAVFLLGGVVTFSPWLIRNFVWTGNPAFPEATRLFGRGHFSEIQVQRWERAHSARQDQRSLSARTVETWNQILADWRYGFVLLPAGISVGVLAARREAMFLLALLAMHFIIWISFTHLQSRFFVLSIPLAGLLMGQIRGRAVWVVAGLIIAMAVLSVLNVNKAIENLNRLRPVDMFAVIAGPRFGTLDHHHLAPSDQVVLVGDARAFLYDIPMQRLHYRTVFDVDAKPGQSAVDAWMNGITIVPGQTVLVIHPSELTRLAATYWRIPAPPEELVGREELVVVRK